MPALAAIACALSAAAFTGSTAEAHSFLESSTPAPGSSVASAPARVSLTFNEPLDSGFAELTVLGPDGTTHWEAAAPTTSGAVVSAPVKPLGPAGKYTVKYRIVSADGHPVSGSYSFTLTKAGAGAAPPSPAPPATPAAQATADDNLPAWVWIAAAAVLLIAGGTVAARLSRSSAPD
ncbi:copper resistance CopC family protein [Amycolatopsis sp. NPDC054798]